MNTVATPLREVRPWTSLACFSCGARPSKVPFASISIQRSGLAHYIVLCRACLTAAMKVTRS